MRPSRFAAVAWVGLVVAGGAGAVGWWLSGGGPRVEPRVPEASEYDFSRVDARVQQLLDTYEVDGAAMRIVRHGAVIYDAQWGGFTEDTVRTVGSASKWMSMSVVMALVEDDVLSLESTVGEYYPDAPADRRDLTLAQLIAHTSGLKRRADCVNDYQATLQDCVQTILAEEARAPAGTEFRYGGVSVHVAAGMAERATGRPWRELFQEHLANPLGLEHSQYGVQGLSANPGIAGNLRTSARDMSRFLQMWLQHGEIEDTRLLRSETIATMEAGQTHDLPREGHLPTRHVRTPHDLYGFGVWRDVVDAAGRAVVVSAPGKFGATPWVDRELGVAGIFLVEIKNGGDVAAARPDPAGIQYLVCDVVDRVDSGPRDRGAGANPRCGIQLRREAAEGRPE